MTTSKKNIITGIIGSIVATTAILSISQANAFERGDKGNKGERRGNAFIRIDFDQSGALSLEELLAPKLARAETRFTSLDIDEDSLISFEEFSQRSTDKPELSEIAAEIVQCVIDIKADTENDNIIVPDQDKFISIEQ